MIHPQSPGEETMRGQWTAAAALGLLTAFASTSAVAFDRGHADTFAVLPSGSTGPEGLTVGPDGNVYVTTFGFNAQGQVPGPSRLLVFDPRGKLLRNVSMQVPPRTHWGLLSIQSLAR